MNEISSVSHSADNICIFLASLSGGGAERVMVTLANGFVASGRVVTVMLAEDTGAFRDDLSPQIEVIELKRRHVSLAVFQLAATLRKRKPDVLLSALHVPNLVALLAAMSSRTSVPTVVSEHSSMTHILQNRTVLRRLILYNAIKVLYPRAARVITVSYGAAAGLKDQFRSSTFAIDVIPNPVDIAEIRTKAKEQAHQLSGEPFIVAVGRLAPEKRFSDLIRAFAIVRKSSQCQLKILGEGPERKRLEELCDQMGLSDAVSFVGFLKNPFSVIQHASALVVSSDREGFGNVLVEGMALGTPVVSTNCPYGPNEILEGGKWGYLVPVGDVKALASAISKTLNAPPVEPAALMARAEAFDKDCAVKSYLKLLDDAVIGARHAK